MLKKQYRLKSRRAFKATYNNNHSVANNIIVLYIGHKRDDKNCPTRVGFVVSKKVHKRAVVRNRVKRQMRESIRLLIQKNNLNVEYQSLIFMARSAILEKSNTEIKNSIEDLYRKVANKNI